MRRGTMRVSLLAADGGSSKSRRSEERSSRSSDRNGTVKLNSKLSEKSNKPSGWLYRHQKHNWRRRFFELDGTLLKQSAKWGDGKWEMELSDVQVHEVLPESSARPAIALQPPNSADDGVTLLQCDEMDLSSWLATLRAAAGGLELQMQGGARGSGVVAAGVLGVLGTTSYAERVWQLRWVELSDSSLLYFERSPTQQPLGSFPLAELTEVAPEPQLSACAFRVSSASQDISLSLQAPSAEARDGWLAAVLEAQLLASVLDLDARPRVSRRPLCCCVSDELPELELSQLSEVAEPGQQDAEVCVSRDQSSGLSAAELRLFLADKKKGKGLKWKCEVIINHGASGNQPHDPLVLKLSNHWSAATMQLKVDKSHEGRLRRYAHALGLVFEAHAAHLDEHGSGPFPMNSSQFVRLTHFLPLLPQQAKHLNLQAFLAKPMAADFLFLQPLVTCAHPAAAKAAFFSSLPQLKLAVKELAAPTQLTAARARELVDMIANKMNEAAVSGGYSTNRCRPISSTLTSRTEGTHESQENLPLPPLRISTSSFDTESDLLLKTLPRESPYFGTARRIAVSQVISDLC
mmetsp:Transcript_24303/g.40208  ORF Transcript_24303/g.40208 Transcript_24303/m.40208 type:complete len:576 (+) Transcript_24303:93-1820(+)